MPPSEPWVPRPRVPGSVPDQPAGPAGCAGPDVEGGLDSDGDGRADTVIAEDGDDLLLHTDLDADGRADRTVRIGGDGSAVEEIPACDEPPSLFEVLWRLLGGSGAGRPG